MSVRWLSFQSFQNSQELISAINTLLIHLKLKSKGDLDTEREEKAKRAKEDIIIFLNKFGKTVSDIKSEGSKPNLGTDIRLRQLARSFDKATNNRRRFQSYLFQNEIDKFEELLEDDNTDKQIWIESLEELRLLIEEHLSGDIDQVLGEY